jgi:hypothetical protein
MKIIAKGVPEVTWPRRWTTPCCKSVLEITPNDIKEDKDYTGGHNSWYIDCPVCGRQPDVSNDMYYDGRRWERQQERMRSYE